MFRRLRFYAIVGIIGALSLIFVGTRNFSGLKATPAPTSVATYEHPLIPRALPTPGPQLSAASFILVDDVTNTVLLAQNPQLRVYPASTTKLATALTALNIYPMDEVVTVNTAYTEGKVMDLKVGENITVRSLVNALLVFSANDAAYNLAAHYPSGIPGFIREMNTLSQKIGLKNTRFVNFDGIHDPQHYTTVADLANLAREAIKNPVIRDTVKKKNLTVTDITGNIRHDLESTNELLGVAPEIEGLKTGWTPEAGGCFVSLMNINGHELVGVVAASDDRFADTLKLLDWAKGSVVWAPYEP